MKNNIVGKDYTITTQRLTMRLLNEDDRDVVFALRSDERVLRNTGVKLCQKIEEADAWINKIKDDMENEQCLIWTGFISSNMHPILSICFWNYSEDKKTAELGYTVLPDHWGQGYISEAIAGVVKFGFEHCKFTEIYAYPRTENIASCRVLEKAAFELVEKKVTESYDGNFLTSIYRKTIESLTAK